MKLTSLKLNLVDYALKCRYFWCNKYQ